MLTRVRIEREENVRAVPARIFNCRLYDDGGLLVCSFWSDRDYETEMVALSVGDFIPLILL